VSDTSKDGRTALEKITMFSHYEAHQKENMKRPQKSVKLKLFKFKLFLEKQQVISKIRTYNPLSAPASFILIYLFKTFN